MWDLTSWLTYGVYLVLFLKPGATIGQQQEEMGASSSLVASTMEANEDHLDWTSDKLGDILDTQWMMNADMN